MRRKLLCGLAAALFGPVLAAQPIPARDLWEFPLGAVLEPAALATEAGTGLWNPASMALSAGARLRVGVAQLSIPSTQGVGAHLIGGAWRRASGTTIGFSVARAAVDGIVRTDTDPQNVGGVIYSTTLLSATVARHIVPHLTAGLSVRYREGRADLEVRTAIAADLGVIVDSLPWRRARLAVASFLWRPGREQNDQPVLLAAADAQLFVKPGAPDIRGGYALNAVGGGSQEHGPFASVRTGRVELRAALLTTRAYGHHALRARSGLALHYARYVVGIGREEGIGGLGPLYQFTLSSTMK